MSDNSNKAAANSNRNPASHSPSTSRAETAGELIFRARLTPYRSLSRSGFRLLMGMIGLICFVVGSVFAIAGVWPVMGFLGLDVLLIYWAFRSNYNAARAYEDVEVTRSHVVLRKVSPLGKQVEHWFDQFGTRFETDRHQEIGITKMRLINRARSVEFGYFLNPEDRATFADAFGQAMAAAKR
ncbi:MAG: DUF2244 domain-containing protein [Pseudomonadota bacterium]